MKTLTITKAFLLLTALIWVGGTFASDCDTPEKTAKAYLDYDLKGERLSSRVSAKIDKLMTENEFEPGWDVSTLVTGYEIKAVTEEGQQAIITVLFKNAWQVSTTFKPKEIKDELNAIHLKNIKGCWRVAPPFYQPHPYSEPYVNHLEELIKSDAKTAKKDWLEHTQSKLNSVLQYRKAQQGGPPDAQKAAPR